MNFIHLDLDKHFIFALKSNQTVALSLEEKKVGKFTLVDSLDYAGASPRTVWIKGVSFPVLLDCQVFTSRDGSVCLLYLSCSDLQYTAHDIEAIYKKWWSVEVFYKTIKSNTALAKSPMKIPLRALVKSSG